MGERLQVRKARLSDAAGIKELISLYPQDVLQVPLFHIFSRIREFFVAEEAGQLIGCVALRIFWSDLAEIRSLAVFPRFQGKGVGSALVNAALDEAKGMGITTVFTLTRAPAFFEKLGFKRVDKAQLPMKVFQDCLLCPKFESGCDEVALIKNLEP